MTEPMQSSEGDREDPAGENALSPLPADSEYLNGQLEKDHKKDPNSPAEGSEANEEADREAGTDPRTVS